MRSSATMLMVAAAIFEMGLCSAFAAPATQSSGSGGHYVQQAIDEIQDWPTHFDAVTQ